MAKNSIKKPKKKVTLKSSPSALTRRSVDVKKANNGFVVSSWREDKEIIYIAKTKKEALSYANKILLT